MSKARKKGQSFQKYWCLADGAALVWPWGVKTGSDSQIFSTWVLTQAKIQLAQVTSEFHICSRSDSLLFQATLQWINEALSYWFICRSHGPLNVTKPSMFSHPEEKEPQEAGVKSCELPVKDSQSCRVRNMTGSSQLFRFSGFHLDIFDVVRTLCLFVHFKFSPSWSFDMLWHPVSAIREALYNII